MASPDRSSLSLAYVLLVAACASDTVSLETASSSTTETGSSGDVIDPSADSSSGFGDTEVASTTSGADASSGTAESSTGPVDPCGNGMIDGDEVCDGRDLGGTSCADIEPFAGGTLGCADDCSAFDTSQCSMASCGNGDLEDDEVCDGDDLGGATCQSEGFDSGTLGCPLTCDALDTDGCGICGNVIVDGDEVCDDIVLLGQTCQSQGFESGALGCTPDCLAYDTSGCGVCGNGVVDGEDLCDGADTAGVDCASLGLGSGVLTCTDDCQGYLTGGCELGCGNDAINLAEVCDGTDLGGQSCESNGYGAGVLACDADCGGFDFSGCGPLPGDCCSANGGLGCVDPECEAAICAFDPFCCDVSWDGICADAAQAEPACADAGGSCT